ncbi:MAG: asparagine--tRNA ligase, partial [Deltaproteobacteria bacterium]|nr:asparagine--tRNA ligase [Deltaproteobacteria bacterium]
METVTIDAIGKYDGQSVTVCGWLTHKRSSGRISFLVLRDGTGIVQATCIKGET